MNEILKGIAIVILFAVVSACNSHDVYYQRILDNLEGFYRIDSVIYINEGGKDSVLLNAGVFYFSPCDVDDNFSAEICSGYYENIQGDTTNFDFQLIDSEKITITPQDLPESFNISSSTIRFEQNESKLRLNFFKRENYEFHVDDHTPYKIVLSKR